MSDRGILIVTLFNESPTIQTESSSSAQDPRRPHTCDAGATQICLCSALLWHPYVPSTRPRLAALVFWPLSSPHFFFIGTLFFRVWNFSGIPLLVLVASTRYEQRCSCHAAHPFTGFVCSPRPKTSIPAYGLILTLP
jgi:hypothetical protein